MAKKNLYQAYYYNMNDIQKRFALFILGCVVVRTLIAMIVRVTPTYLEYYGYVAIILAMSFIYLFVTNGRKTGPEVFGGTIWWNGMRSIHGILLLVFAYLALMGNVNSWKILLLDVFIGLLAFLNYHYTAGNFPKLLE